MQLSGCLRRGRISIWVDNPVNGLKIDAIAFDLDGTLVETNDAWHCGLNRILRLYGKDEGVSKEFFFENHVGVAQPQVLQSHLNLSEEELVRAVDKFNEIFISSIEQVRLQEGVLELLEFVSGFTGGMAIITNAYRKAVDEILNNLASRSLDIKGYFDSVVTRDDVVKGKPDPEMIYLTCTRLAVRPGNMVYVEDSPSGVIAGKRAGCYVIGYTSSATVERLRGAGADEVVNSFSEIKDLLLELRE